MVGSGSSLRRLRADIEISGVPHGVGFRPYVYRLARACRVDGDVTHVADGVLIRASGTRMAIEEFMYRLHRQVVAPKVSIRSRLVADELPRGFTIGEDVAGGRAAVSFDRATCDTCLSELRDPYDRRFRYAFTNCANCGPRASIVTAWPYGRARTTMESFRLCSGCATEYADPAGRRYHAEAVGCPKCGPRVNWRLGESSLDVRGPDVLGNAVAVLAEGGLVAVKSPGGYRVYADAAVPGAVQRLRALDPRPPSVLVSGEAEVDGLSEGELARLSAVDSPIVLVRSPGLVSLLAPGLDEIGVQLPYTPLLHLLTADLGRPLAFTPGPRLVIDDDEALATFGSVVDGILGHNQPIARATPDAVLRMDPGGGQHLQHAGRAPVDPSVSTVHSGLVQRQHALVVATAAEHDVPGPFIGVAYDAPRPGFDGTYWGGDILLAGYADFMRVGRFAYAPMPGGDAIADYPASLALGYLFGLENLGGNPIEPELADTLLHRLDAGLVTRVRREVDDASRSSSASMLYEAMAAMLDVGDVNTYPGEAADMLAGTVGAYEDDVPDALPWRLARSEGLWVYDPTPTLRAALLALKEGLPVGRIAAAFEGSLVEVTVAMVNEVARKTMIQAVCLGGSVFTHRRLTKRMLAALTEQGYGAFLGETVASDEAGEEYGRTAVLAARRKGR